MYESSTKETKWVCIQLACSRRPKAFEEAHCWNIQAKFYNEKFPLVYESDKTIDSLSWRYGGTLKHKCGKKDSNIVPSLFLSHFFFLFSFFGPTPFFMAFLFFGGLLSFLWPSSFYLFIPHLGQCSNNDGHHTSIYLQFKKLQLNTRTKIWLYVNASGGVPGCAMNQEWHVWKNYEWWLCHKYYVNYMIMQSNMTMINVSW